MNFTSIKKNWLYILVIALTAGAVGYGSYYIASKSKSSSVSSATADDGTSPSSRDNTSRGGWGGRGSGNRVEPISGTISSISDSVIKLTTSDNSEKTITVTSDTRIDKMDNGTRTELQLSDLQSGDEISVMGDNSQSSSFEARMIILGKFEPPSDRGNWGGGNDGSAPNNLDSNIQSSDST